MIPQFLLLIIVKHCMAVCFYQLQQQYCSAMQEYKLPKVIHHLQNKKSSSMIGNKLRQRKILAHRKLNFPHHSITESGLANLHQIINFSTNNFTILQKRRRLSQCIDNQKIVSLTQLPSNHNKVLIFNQRCLDTKENHLEDLKAFKSLLNTKSKTPKKVIVFNAYKNVLNSIRYIDRNSQSLWQISNNQSNTQIFKQAKCQDFSLQPWNDEQL